VAGGGLLLEQSSAIFSQKKGEEGALLRQGALAALLAGGAGKEGCSRLERPAAAATKGGDPSATRRAKSRALRLALPRSSTVADYPLPSLEEALLSLGITRTVVAGSEEALRWRHAAAESQHYKAARAAAKAGKKEEERRALASVAYHRVQLEAFQVEGTGQDATEGALAAARKAEDKEKGRLVKAGKWDKAKLREPSSLTVESFPLPSEEEACRVLDRSLTRLRSEAELLLLRHLAAEQTARDAHIRALAEGPHEKTALSYAASVYHHEQAAALKKKEKQAGLAAEGVKATPEKKHKEKGSKAEPRGERGTLIAREVEQRDLAAARRRGSKEGRRRQQEVKQASGLPSKEGGAAAKPKVSEGAADAVAAAESSGAAPHSPQEAAAATASGGGAPNTPIDSSSPGTAAARQAKAGPASPAPQPLPSPRGGHSPRALDDRPWLGSDGEATEQESGKRRRKHTRYSSSRSPSSDPSEGADSLPSPPLLEAVAAVQRELAQERKGRTSAAGAGGKGDTRGEPHTSQEAAERGEGGATSSEESEVETQPSKAESGDGGATAAAPAAAVASPRAELARTERGRRTHSVARSEIQVPQAQRQQEGESAADQGRWRDGKEDGSTEVQERTSGSKRESRSRSASSGPRRKHQRGRSEHKDGGSSSGTPRTDRSGSQSSHTNEGGGSSSSWQAYQRHNNHTYSFNPASAASQVVSPRRSNVHSRKGGSRKHPNSSVSYIPPGGFTQYANFDYNVQRREPSPTPSLRPVLADGSLGAQLDLVRAQGLGETLGEARTHLRGLTEQYCLAAVRADFFEASHAAASQVTGVERAEVQQQRSAAAAAAGSRRAVEAPPFVFQEPQPPVGALAVASAPAPLPPFTREELEEFALFRQQRAARQALQAQGGSGAAVPEPGAQQPGGSGV
jgi:hypothetical protein